MIIRFEERKHRGEVRASLHNHRVHDVRDEQRASLLAYGFLRGRSYSTIETNADVNHGSYRRALLRAERIAEKFGQQDVRIIRLCFAEWVSAGVAERLSKQPSNCRTRVRVLPPAPSHG